MTLVAQFPLPFPHAQGFQDADFLRFPSNEAALSWLERPADWPGGRLALFGEPGCGKTHLLCIWARRHQARHLSGTSLAGLPELPEGKAGALLGANYLRGRKLFLSFASRRFFLAEP